MKNPQTSLSLTFPLNRKRKSRNALNGTLSKILNQCCVNREGGVANEGGERREGEVGMRDEE